MFLGRPSSNVSYDLAEVLGMLEKDEADEDNAEDKEAAAGDASTIVVLSGQEPTSVVTTAAVTQEKPNEHRVKGGK